MCEEQDCGEKTSFSFDGREGAPKTGISGITTLVVIC